MVYPHLLFSRIGYFFNNLLETSRLVVDTGIHAKNWTYETAKAYFVENTDLTTSEIEWEIHTIVTKPGYKSAAKGRSGKGNVSKLMGFMEN